MRIAAERRAVVAAQEATERLTVQPRPREHPVENYVLMLNERSKETLLLPAEDSCIQPEAKTYGSLVC